MSEEAGIRLAKPRKKGILSLIFSRFFLIVLAILVELAVMILPVILLGDYLRHFYLGLAIFTLLAKDGFIQRRLMLSDVISEF